MVIQVKLESLLQMAEGPIMCFVYLWSKEKFNMALRTQDLPGSFICIEIRVE